MLRRLFAGIVKSQMVLSECFDRLLPAHFRLDGNQDFLNTMLPSYLRPGQIVYDIGGGKQPYIDAEAKQRLGLTVIGIDIDQHELDQAPADVYDETICTDICAYTGRGDADLVICQAVLEHVRNVECAIGALASILKPGGIAVIFVPSKNAIFARINTLLPQRMKSALLYAIFPRSKNAQGFPAYYDRCTPKAMTSLATMNGLVVEERRLYYISNYFSFCFPLYLLWRCWILAGHLLARVQSAETFSLALRKPLPTRIRGEHVIR